MDDFKHELIMNHPKTGQEVGFYFNHSILDELEVIRVFWIPAGFYDFYLDGIPIEIPPSDPEAG